MSDIEQGLAALFKGGVDDIVVRVCQYAADAKTPTSFQALIRFANRSAPMGVGIRANPVAALRAAIEDVQQRGSAPAPPEPEVDHEDMFG